MSNGVAAADALRGMHGTTAPDPARGSGHTRLHADIASLGRLDPDRLPAADRLQTALGGELAQRLVHALTRSPGRLVDAA